MDIAAYFDRIRYTGPLAPTSRSLRTLHRHHMMTVPFENLDVGLGRKIVLDSGRLVKKIVEERRGGFCYELNGAFASLLATLGFRVQLLSARVADRKGVLSREFDHLALQVDVPEGHGEEATARPGSSGRAWLVDVGFGDNFLEPLRFVTDVEQEDPAGRFRLIHPLRSRRSGADGRWQLERRDEEGEWRLQYDFALQPRELSEFAEMCHYHQTSRNSKFRRNRICSLATPAGRITLSGSRLITRSNGNREERTLETESEVHSALRHHFGIVLNHPPAARPERRRAVGRGAEPAAEPAAC